MDRKTPSDPIPEKGITRTQSLRIRASPSTPSGFTSPPTFTSPQPGFTSPNVQQQSSTSATYRGSILPDEFYSQGTTTSRTANVDTSSLVPPVERPVERRRGRPRKYGHDGEPSLASTPRAATRLRGRSPGRGRNSPGRGRNSPGRGRNSPGRGRNQQLASPGVLSPDFVGTGFTPQSLTINTGQDIVASLMSFSQQVGGALCILSANGSVSNPILGHPLSSGVTERYEGVYEIITLSGSYTPTGISASSYRIGGLILSISLAAHDRHAFGGGVSGVLYAASLVQVMVGSFLLVGTPSLPAGGVTPSPDVTPSLPAGGVTPSPDVTPRPPWPEGSQFTDMCNNSDSDSDDEIDLVI